VHSSVYCLPADLLGEGADRVVGTVRDRAGVSGVTVAACYHASRDIYPHNPAYRVASLAPGAFYAVDPSAYPGPLRPAVSASAVAGTSSPRPAGRPPRSGSRSRPGPSCCTAMTWTTASPGSRRTASATVSPAASARPARPRATTRSP